MAQQTRYSYETLHAFSIAVLTAAGAPAGHAAAVADHLIDANLAGHDSHGAHRLMQYTDAIADGGIDPQASPRTVRDGTTTAVLDATGVFGQVAGLAAAELAIAKASAHGTAVVGVRGANHVGRAGVYALKIAEAGLVGQVFCSGRGAGIVAPWGGTTPLLSTNPIAVPLMSARLAVPTAGEPILVDITTSVTAEGKVRVARYAGKELAPGQILDRDGNPSTRPDDLYEGGSIDTDPRSDNGMFERAAARRSHGPQGLRPVGGGRPARRPAGRRQRRRQTRQRLLQQLHPVGRGSGRARRTGDDGGVAAGVLRAAQVIRAAARCG